MLEIATLIAAGSVLYALHRLSGYWRWHQYRKAILRNNWFDPAINPSGGRSQPPAGSAGSR
jgi:hypothetical protein